MLNLWRPSPDLQARLKEGARYRAYNLSVATGNKRSPGASVQLTATSKTHYQEVQVPHAQIRAAVQLLLFIFNAIHLKRKAFP